MVPEVYRISFLLPVLMLDFPLLQSLGCRLRPSETGDEEGKASQKEAFECLLSSSRIISDGQQISWCQGIAKSRFRSGERMLFEENIVKHIQEFPGRRRRRTWVSFCERREECLLLCYVCVVKLRHQSFRWYLKWGGDVSLNSSGWGKEKASWNQALIFGECLCDGTSSSPYIKVTH